VVTQSQTGQEGEQAPKRQKVSNMVYRKRGVPRGKTLNHKVSALQRKVALISPEVKNKDITVTGASIVDGGKLAYSMFDAIAAGTGVDQRVGENIKVVAIEIRGNVWGSQAAAGVDCYIVRPKDSTRIPAYADFQPTIGGFYDRSYGHTLYHELAQRTNNQYNFLNYKRNFHNGINAEYLATTCSKGDLYFVLKNDSGATTTGIEFAIRVWYYDA